MNNNCKRCNCSCNKTRVESTAVAVVGANLQITIPTSTFHDGQFICFEVEQPIPTTGLGLPDVILSGVDTIPLFDRNDETVRGYEIIPERCYTLRYAVDGPGGAPIFQVKSKLCRQPSYVPEDSDTVDTGGV